MFRNLKQPVQNKERPRKRNSLNQERENEASSYDTINCQTQFLIKDWRLVIELKGTTAYQFPLTSEEIQHLTQHYVYPEDDFSPASADVLKGAFYNQELRRPLTKAEEQELNYYNEQLNKWQKSFAKLYDKLREGSCPYFYFMSSDVTAIFLSPKASANGEFGAIVHRVLPELRKTLEGAKVTLTACSSMEEQTITKKLKISTRDKLVQSKLNQVLMVKGGTDLERIYKCLFEWRMKSYEKRAQALPVLRAPVGFDRSATTEAVVEVRV
ncbi:10562_t:CDS:2 [Paraglomus brasilianum]|uniref:10562_t:CDS:1 n=1 Tax=Paraglomus brasilianum TaxID=144538 RepID=A0A9N9AVT8_9GLOM|nr:10562_t:CDS:2 [Paraglomus brasilianum]